VPVLGVLVAVGDDEVARAAGEQPRETPSAVSAR
jgi:hypothetical protein